MVDTNSFLQHIQQAYTFKGESVKIGGAVLDGEVIPGTEVRLPLKTLNRHGLIAGATGTGKTKTLQMISESLSNVSVPVLVMDIKGDLSGIAIPGTLNDSLSVRCQKLNITYQPQGNTVELLKLGEKIKGLQMRATVSEFGPTLLSKILGLNDTQQGVVALLFKYADDNHLPLLDLKDFTKLLQYAANEGKAEAGKNLR